MGMSPDKPKETQAERAQADVSARFLEIENQVSRPALKQFQNRALNIEGDRRRALGDANAEYEGQFSDVTDKVINSQAQAGAARLKGAIVGVTRDLGNAKGAGLADVNAAVEDQAVRNRQGIVRLGLNQAADGVAGFGDAAKVARRQSLRDADSSAAVRQAVGSAVGTVGGTYVGARLGAAATEAPEVPTGYIKSTRGGTVGGYETDPYNVGSEYL